MKKRNAPLHSHGILIRSLKKRAVKMSTGMLQRSYLNAKESYEKTNKEAHRLVMELFEEVLRERGEDIPND